MLTDPYINKKPRRRRQGTKHHNALCTVRIATFGIGVDICAQNFFAW